MAPFLGLDGVLGLVDRSLAVLIELGSKFPPLPLPHRFRRMVAYTENDVRIQDMVVFPALLELPEDSTVTLEVSPATAGERILPHAPDVRGTQRFKGLVVAGAAFAVDH